jgi:hypothetical protein
LARAGAGEDQLTAQRRGYGLALGIVQGVQEKGEIVMHRGILGAPPEQGKPTIGQSVGRSAGPAPEALPK